MNTFNRVVLIILLLLAMGVCSLVFVVPQPALRFVAIQARGLADFLDRIRPIVRLPVGILLALIVDLIGVLLIILEVRRPAAQSINVQQASGGEVRLTIASIADQLRAEINQLPDVLQVNPKVSAKRKGVLVELNAKIAAEADVPHKAERIVERVERVIEEKMGLKLARPPRINIEAVRRVQRKRPSGQSPPVPSRETEPSQVSDTESKASEQ